MPFAVVGSNATIEVQGKKVRGRRYPWGVVEGWCCGVRGAQESLTSLVNIFLFTMRLSLGNEVATSNGENFQMWSNF